MNPNSAITVEDAPAPDPRSSAASAYRAPTRLLSNLWVVPEQDSEGDASDRRILACLGLKVSSAIADVDGSEVIYIVSPFLLLIDTTLRFHALDGGGRAGSYVC